MPQYIAGASRSGSVGLSSDGSELKAAEAMPIADRLSRNQYKQIRAWFSAEK